MIVYKYDEQGYFVEPVLLKENQAIPSNCTDVALPEVNYKPRFVEGQWIEILSTEEIAELTHRTLPISPFDELKKQQELMQQAIDDLILGGIL